MGRFSYKNVGFFSDRCELLLKKVLANMHDSYLGKCESLIFIIIIATKLYDVAIILRYFSAGAQIIII